MITDGQRGPHQGSSPPLHEEGMRCRLHVICESAEKVVWHQACWGLSLIEGLHTAQPHEAERGEHMP